MRYVVLVKPNAKQNLIEELDKNVYKVSVTEPATEDKANNAMLKLFGKHLGVAPSRLFIRYGAKARRKIVEVDEQYF